MQPRVSAVRSQLAAYPTTGNTPGGDQQAQEGLMEYPIASVDSPYLLLWA